MLSVCISRLIQNKEWSMPISSSLKYRECIAKDYYSYAYNKK